MDAIAKTLEYFKRLPYTMYREPLQDSDGSNYWIAEYVELRGCKTDGATEAEAIANLQELFDEYISTRIENGEVIPEPKEQFASVPAIWVAVGDNTPKTKDETAYNEVAPKIAA